MPYFTWAHHPHPYYAHRAAFMFHRGPRRFLPKLLWFGLGAGAFAMWSRHHAGSVDSSSKLKQLGMNGEWEHSAHRTTQRQQGTTELPAQQSIREVGRQAESVMSEISETALDALMSSLQVLKAKLAETRDERELGRDADKLYLEHRLSSENSSSTSTDPTRRPPPPSPQPRFA